MMQVCNISSAAERIVRRLPDNPSGIPVRVGWDGQRIAIFAGTYSTPAKSLPNARILVPIGAQFEEVETMLALAVAQLRKELPSALAKGPAKRSPRPRHHWRSGAIDQAKFRD